MNATALDFVTTQELISELIRRKTFLGVVVHSTEELRSDRWRGERVFRIQHSDNLELDEAGRLLGVIADRMSEQQDA
jgi:hypothetical protein